MKHPNPFTPTFGHVPPMLAGRSEYIDDVLEGLQNGPGDPNRATIFVGARGSGKTVLLSAIANEAQQQGWVCANVTAGEGMLDELLVQTRVSASHLIPAEASARITGLSFSGTGVSLQRTEPLTTWRSEMTTLVQAINDAGAGLLLTVDEVSATSKAMATLSETFQHFVREGRNVALLMAGLPQQVSTLLQDDGTTFLRRAFQRQLGAIGFDDVIDGLRATVEEAGRTIAAGPLCMAADATQGFAYMIQLIGYQMWRQHPEEREISQDDVELGIVAAARELERSVFIPTLRSLTGREVGYLVALANLERPAKNSEVAAKLAISQSNASNVRRRLLEQGVLMETGRASIDFQIPFLAEHLLESEG